MTQVTVTESAQVYLKSLLDKQDVDGIGVRLFVSQPGTTYAETCLAYCRPGEEKRDDERLQLESFVAYLDQPSLPYLDEAIVDYVADKLGGQLTIKAPKAKQPTVAFEGPLETQIVSILTTEVNPSLASHGGEVRLIRLEDDVAILQFGGGCQGCSAVDMTLKDGVQRTLMERIPELKGVRDVTDHSQRDNAYYR
ncbi:MAG: Fe-S biogenesis protein NfuA [Litorivicinaceae bacterium]|jgi:Fe/S biogenesis protein NfuA|nr:Fe-S biogenesis protein NfuA [Litorivicinaceae bacterium]MDP5329588.1 Fe-S biogenesis protein NfuA [Litorivicinaceae bacterium]MDP5331333.1 Fe-S biogenesis protein NfuA [Litorivicinaceae bacterium]MDP5340961.1 Fe-S biogenesis protein NfuA [Litorivicinaceae bacterium]MDP5342643.1 Fe-S biogenesis protein NfuA [Litorivicinaceae bacterium]